MIEGHNLIKDLAICPTCHKPDPFPDLRRLPFKRPYERPVELAHFGTPLPYYNQIDRHS